MQILYEISAGVREDLAEDFEQYMNERHIPDVLATGAFESATFVRAGSGRYRITYIASRENLAGYLRDHAPRLRAHVAETFPGGLELSREEWEVVGTFKK